MNFKAVALTLLSCCVCYLAACASVGELSAASPKSPVDFKLLDYYEKKCERCHGEGGEYHPDGWGDHMTDAEVKAKVAMMAAGPGGSPVYGGKLDALTAFHRSMLDRAPFILVHTASKTSITGDVTYGASMKATNARKSAAIKVKNGRWTFKYPSGWTIASTSLVATRNKKTTTLKPAVAAFSHTKPKKAP